MEWMRQFLVIGMAAAAGFSLAGCTKSADLSANAEQQERNRQSLADRSPSDQASRDRDGIDAAPDAERERAGMAKKGLQPVYFDFDQSSLRADARATLRANADWLKANPQARVRIEGNCDERGTIEYNQALGQRRAAVTKRYLQEMGIRLDRMALMSYGKDNPVCADFQESCWQQNRRAELIVLSK